MANKTNTSNEQSQAEVSVKSFLRHMNNEDFKEARNFLSPSFKFIGALATVDGADKYIKEMSQMKFKYDIDKYFINENSVAVFYTIDMGKTQVEAAGLYETDNNGKITFAKVIYDSAKASE